MTTSIEKRVATRYLNHLFASEKAIRLDPKEVARADSGYTVIVRPQPKGFMVAIVEIVEGNKGRLIGHTSYVPTKSDVPAAVKELVRWLEKLNFRGEMGGASRSRNF